MPLPMSTMNKCDQDPEYFRDEILSKFRDTERGRLGQTDTFIKAVGKFNYDRQRKDPSKASLAHKDAMSDMNTLASLFLVFKQIALDQQFVIMVEQKDMLNHQHFELFCEAIEKRSKSENCKLKLGRNLTFRTY